MQAVTRVCFPPTHLLTEKNSPQPHYKSKAEEHSLCFDGKKIEPPARSKGGRPAVWDSLGSD